MKLNTVSTILSVAASFGVIATAATAIEVSPKVVDKIREKAREKERPLTKKELVQTTWKYYIPTALIGASTIFCIAGANRFNKKAQASITSAYALLNETHREYKNKLKELYGEEAHNKIIDEIAKEKARDVYISAPGICGSTSVDWDDDSDECVFYDSFSKRYFESTINRVLQAEYHLNRNFCLGMPVTINHFYEFLGIDLIDGGDDLYYPSEDGIMWVDFNHRDMLLDDGSSIHVIDHVFPPRVLED